MKKSISNSCLNIQIISKENKTGFKLLNGINRPIIPSQVTKLSNSILKMGIIRPIVIANISFISGKAEKYIIDGQHLFHALLRCGLNFPVVYIEVLNEVDLIEKIALLNASSKSWTSLDYITAWKYVRSDYAKIEKLYNTYDLQLTQIVEIAMSGTMAIQVGGSLYSRRMKAGQVVIKDYEKTVKLLNYITDALKIVPRMDRSSNKLFISCYVRFINNDPNYNHEAFMKWLEINKKHFNLATQDPEEMTKLLSKAK